MVPAAAHKVLETGVGLPLRYICGDTVVLPTVTTLVNAILPQPPLMVAVTVTSPIKLFTLTAAPVVALMERPEGLLEDQAI